MNDKGAFEISSIFAKNQRLEQLKNQYNNQAIEIEDPLDGSTPK